MKKLSRVFAARPTINMSVILLSIGLMISPYISYAYDNEEDLILETWMTIPFEIEFTEAELQMEDWMTIPFEIEFTEAELQMEDWMKVPFEKEFTEAELQMEDWMTRDWI